MDEKSVGQLRLKLADILNATVAHGEITYITNRGRRIAAIVPVTIAEAAEAEAKPGA